MLKAIIADDDAVFTRYVQKCADWLDLHTEVIFCAHNGADFVDLCRKHRPEILVLDVEMPLLTGLQCLECLQPEGLNSQILLVTGRDEFRYAQEGAKYGVSDILLKPVSKSNLDKALRRLVNRYWALRIPDYVMQSLVGKPDADAVLALLGEDTPEDSAISICKKILRAIQDGTEDKLRMYTSLYINQLADLSLPYNQLVYIYAFPMLACAAMLHNRTKTELPYPFKDGMTMINQLNVKQMENVERVMYETFSQASDIIHGPSADLTKSLPEKVKEYLQEHYSDPNLSVSDVARELHFNETYLRRIFKLTYGKTPGTVLRDIRMTEAKRLLEQGNIQIQQVSQMVGIEDPSYFSKCYKQYFGYSPSMKNLL